MSLEPGYDSYLGVAEEAAFGTAESAPDEYVRYVGEGLTYEKPTQFSASVGQHYQRRPWDGKKAGGGDTEHEMQFEGFNILLKHVFGAKATVAGTGFGTHTFTSAAALPTGLTLFLGKSSFEIIYAGSKISKVEFSQESGELLKTIFSFVHSGTVATGTVRDPSSSWPTDSEVVYTQGVLKIDGSDLSTDIKNCRVALENPLNEDVYGVTKDVRSALPRSDLVVVSGEILPWLDGETMRDKFANSSKCTLELTYTGGSVGTGGTYSFKLRIGALKFTPTADANTDSADILEMPMPFVGYVDDKTSIDPYEPIELEVVNSETT